MRIGKGSKVNLKKEEVSKKIKERFTDGYVTYKVTPEEVTEYEWEIQEVEINSDDLKGYVLIKNLNFDFMYWLCVEDVEPIPDEEEEE